jgi:predicted AlkP superfamily pyrophosphatase or phosphodiesterase
VQRTAVLNVVGLTRGLIGRNTPRIDSFRKAGATASIKPPFPAVTCTAQSDYLTGVTPSEHGIVANGWYNREYAETHFWKQPDHLVQHPKIWDELRKRDPKFTCAKLFWWYNMYGKVDWSITPRPMYPADGRKFFDIYSWPSNIGEEIKSDLGEFPFFGFWGPAAGVDSVKGKADCVSRWIANAAKWIEDKHQPTLNLVYLPHLDYNLQRLGPDNGAVGPDLEAIDMIVGELITFFSKRNVNVVLLSEYGITPVDTPVHLNRIFREQGWITVREEQGRELLDFGNSKVFAVADHQVAHIYLNDRSLRKAVLKLLSTVPGIDRVLADTEKLKAGISHPRAGDLIAVAKTDAWFTYYYWQDDNRAPDFARTVDIHRKPGYDPCELFIDPQLTFPKLRIAKRLLQKKLGFRMLMDVVPLDADLVRGSHGACPEAEEHWPVVITQQHNNLPDNQINSTDVYNVIRAQVLGEKFRK